MRRIKISFFLNIIIVVFTLLASIMMFTGLKFMHGMEPILEVTKLGMFKFFTVDSNILMGITSLIFLYQEKKMMNKSIKVIPSKYYALKLMATVSVSITFIVVFLYLGSVAKYGLISLLQNSNLFFHLLIPLLSIITFVFFESNNLKSKYVIYSIIPTLIYELFYMINIFIHMENGKISPLYDWYYFLQGGIWQMIIVGPFMLIITYFIGFILFKLNKIFAQQDNI